MRTGLRMGAGHSKSDGLAGHGGRPACWQGSQTSLTISVEQGYSIDCFRGLCSGLFLSKPARLILRSVLDGMIFAAVQVHADFTTLIDTKSAISIHDWQKSQQ